MNTNHTFRSRLERIRRKLHVSNLSLRLAITIVFLVLFAKLVENNILFPKFNDRHARQIQHIFTEKEQTLLQGMEDLRHCTQTPGNDSCLIRFHNRHSVQQRERGLYYFVYRNDTLEYWSTGEVCVPETYSTSEFDQPYVSLGDNRYASGKYASFVKKTDGVEIVGLALIKNVYTYENKYLKMAFQKEFGLPANVKISPEKVKNGYSVKDSNGRFVWALIFDRTCIYRYQIFVPSLVYLLVLAVYLILLDSVFDCLRSAVSRNVYLSILALILAGTGYVMQHFRFPGVLSELELFSPIHFASAWFPSFGELVLWCILVGFFSFELYRYLRFPLFYEHRWKYFVYLGTSMMIVIVGFFGIGLLLKAMMINSSDIFEGTNRILQLNRFSLVGYTIVMLFFTSFFLLLDKTIQLCKQELIFHQYLTLYVIALSMAVIGWSMAGLYVSPTSIVFLTLLVCMAGNFRLKRTVKLRYSHYVLLVFILALFTSVYLNHYSYKKYEDRNMILVTNLASQHDLTAEFLLRSISDRILSDAGDELADAVYRDYPLGGDYPNVVGYIKRQYFYSSYWNKYFEPRCWVCGDTSQLLITGQMRKDNCVGYFKYMTDRLGNKLPRSEFWYIDRQDPASTYLGWFRVEKNGSPPLQLFIELWPGSSSEEVGYPELLLDDRLVKGNNLKDYSYAKYRNNRRITQYGDYKYNLKGDIFQTDPSDYHTVYADGMEHLVYRPDKNNMIVLSSYSPKFTDLIINFSYIFIIFFIVVSVFLLIFYLPFIRRNFQWNFRNKIQYAMIAVMLVSFAVIGTFTIIYINRQYRSKNNDLINEKMKAIHSELQDAILSRKNLDDKSTEGREMLIGWMADIQKLFFTDINLFDVHGQLIATSLPDVFDKGLVGRQINPNAYIQLAFGQRASIIEHEEIGELHYISAYEPFLDNDNRVIAFLNLPYFTHQDALSEEISTVVIALLNFYMVIILFTVIVSVMMSNQITQPLMMLQEKFRNIKLGAKNEPILYESHDELGGLVKEYNRAIEELARSAGRLARSERESAWREMAKQIAHEINNPLTPMKLSIQHLKRAYDNKSERFDMYMQKISRSLVEQIDELSAIATEFSTFAKMPVPQNERLDLIDKINNVVPLFAVDENKRAFHTDFHGLECAIVCADKEQMSRVFINLFKNALQAIPKDRQAEIHIDVLKINRIVWVRVKDNGTGIPLEMQEKIFRPNFTTKSSGMGVGLSIVRNIIENAGGTISFKTRQGEGTTFMISLPALE